MKDLEAEITALITLYVTLGGIYVSALALLAYLQLRMMMQDQKRKFEHRQKGRE